MKNSYLYGFKYDRKVWFEEHISRRIYNIVHSKYNILPEYLTYRLWEWEFRISYNFGMGDN